ncbi:MULTISPECIES: phosphotransferase [Streptomyces]|uniref:phosphotransferase n=1 Tax=Streptomyces TaxID=1883 RepID=UPI00099895D9|nr:phosphotransferase [Streptomyces californicus]NEA09505.1 phosphotransferase [Streptomyces sp. SID10692]
MHRDETAGTATTTDVIRADAPPAIDRGRFPDAVTPWEDPVWRADALAWIAENLAAHGLAETAPRSVRLRPWSVLVRLTVTGPGPVWFKAVPPAAAFEAGLTDALARWVPDHVLTPLAVEVERGWVLTPDGGPVLAEVLDGAAEEGRAADPRYWEEPLRRYAAMQRALTPYAKEIAALGVPVAGPGDLPALFDRLVAENAALTRDDRVAMEALRPRVADWCEELAATGVADSLDHADLHEKQVFAPGPGRYAFFDWGDALVGHPFCSLLVPARAALDRCGPEALPRLRDAYLEPWTGGGASAAELRRAVRTAWRLAALGRAASWGRMFPAPPGAPAVAGDEEGAYWLRELAVDPPL